MANASDILSQLPANHPARPVFAALCHGTDGRGSAAATGKREGQGTGKRSPEAGSARSVRLVLPLPAKELSPNARCHYMAKARKAKAYRNAAMICTVAAMRQAGIREPWQAATAQATFHFRHNRARDRDNLLASLKNGFDGIADAGLVVNDSQITHLPVLLGQIDKRNPHVVIVIESTNRSKL
jgi:crossover junction endodeoxyribonuclease RusA